MEAQRFIKRQTDHEITDQLEAIVGPGNLIRDPEQLHRYGHDETETLHFKPDWVVLPESPEQISALLKLCNDLKIPVTPRGAGTGLSGGALPHLGGLVIAMERFNRILEIDEDNLQVTTEPGVITELLQEAVAAKGLFYPPDPASKGSCFIGGNVAENSGGPRAVKYGVVSDYVLNLQMVLPTGEIIWTGANVLKNATGYNLTQLVVGSEGTLGIVTKIVLRLIPLPRVQLLLLAPFNVLDQAATAVSAIFRAGYTPSVLELMEISALKVVDQMVDQHVLPVDDSIAAHLLIEIDGQDSETLYREMEQIAGVLEKEGAGELLMAETTEQKDALWKLRRQVAENVKRAGYTIEEDTVVPRAVLPELIRGLKALEKQHDFEAVAYGHAGDGNLHIRIKKEGHPNSYGDPVMDLIIRDLFQLVHQLGGTLSGEHGIGILQKGFTPIVFEPVQLHLMRQIKQAFDPNGILNAGKIFDA